MAEVCYTAVARKHTKAYINYKCLVVVGNHSVNSFWGCWNQGHGLLFVDMIAFKRRDLFAFLGGGQRSDHSFQRPQSRGLRQLSILLLVSVPQ